MKLMLFFVIISILLVLIPAGVIHSSPTSVLHDLSNKIPGGILSITHSMVFNNEIYFTATATTFYGITGVILQYNTTSSTVTKVALPEQIAQSNGTFTALITNSNVAIFSLYNTTGSYLLVLHQNNTINIMNNTEVGVKIDTMDLIGSDVYLGGSYSGMHPYLAYFSPYFYIIKNISNIFPYPNGEISNMSSNGTEIMLSGVISGTPFLYFLNPETSNFTAIPLQQYQSVTFAGSLWNFPYFYIIGNSKNFSYLLRYDNSVNSLVNLSYILPYGGKVGIVSSITEYGSYIAIVGVEPFIGIMPISGLMFIQVNVNSYSSSAMDTGVSLGSMLYLGGMGYKNGSTIPLLWAYSASTSPSNVTILIYPRAVDITSPENITFYANVTESYNFTFMWYVNGEPVNSTYNEMTYYFDKAGLYNISVIAIYGGTILGGNWTDVVYYKNTSGSASSAISNNLMKYTVLVIGGIAVALELAYIYRKSIGMRKK